MKIHLNYAQLAHATPSWAWGLLLSALLIAATASWEYFRLEAERAGLQLRLQNDSSPPVASVRETPPSAEIRTALQEQVRQANSVLGELGRPWPAMLSLLERTTRPEVALLAIRPDAAKGRLHIAGEARNLAAVLAYVRRLAASGLMTDVVLEEHEVVGLNEQTSEQEESDQQKPVRFALSARWEGSNGER